MTIPCEAALPGDSILAGCVSPGDFVDCYASRTDLDAASVARRLVDFPAWVGWLMALRNLLVAPFGLKTVHQAGDRIGIFPVAQRATNEILLGFNDWHLDFRLSVIRRNDLAYAATRVRTHNLVGRTYLWIIMPFHRLIIRNAMNRVSGA